MKNFKVIDFRFAGIDDTFDLKYRAWSRIYEYKYVLDFIKNQICKDLTMPLIHNTSWGYEGVHAIFRDELDTIGQCVHSDIVSSKYRETYYYDITTENSEFVNNFDFVLNVSTIEHLNTPQDRLLAIYNLYKQIKNNGYLILTFDYPRVNLMEIENLVGVKCAIPKIILNGENSASPNDVYKELNIVYLILQKNE